MLSGHDGWETSSTDVNESIVTKWQQAMMLTVNTLAFAAPYSVTTGFVDTVWYDDPNDSAVRYYGYTPQPFITQVAAFFPDTDAAPGSQYFELGVAVELYNPTDRALDASQFYISFEQTPPGAGAVVNANTFALNGQGQMPLIPARSFVTVSFSNPGNVVFESGLGNQGTANPDCKLDQSSAANWDLDVKVEALSKFDVSLWRSGSSGGRYMVDRMTVNQPETVGIDTVDPVDILGEWETAYRDTTAASTFGPANSLATRWRVATAFEWGDNPTHNAAAQVKRYEFGSGTQANLDDPNAPCKYTLGTSAPTVARAGNRNPAVHDERLGVGREALVSPGGRHQRWGAKTSVRGPIRRSVSC